MVAAVDHKRHLVAFDHLVAGEGKNNVVLVHHTVAACLVRRRLRDRRQEVLQSLAEAERRGNRAEALHTKQQMLGTKQNNEERSTNLLQAEVRDNRLVGVVVAASGVVAAERQSLEAAGRNLQEAHRKHQAEEHHTTES